MRNWVKHRLINLWGSAIHRSRNSSISPHVQSSRELPNNELIWDDKAAGYGINRKFMRKICMRPNFSTLAKHFVSHSVSQLGGIDIRTHKHTSTQNVWHNFMKNSLINRNWRRILKCSFKFSGDEVFPYGFMARNKIIFMNMISTCHTVFVFSFHFLNMSLIIFKTKIKVGVQIKFTNIYVSIVFIVFL